MRGLLRIALGLTFALVVSCALGLADATECPASFTPLTSGGDNCQLRVSGRWVAWQDHESGSGAIRILDLNDDSRREINPAGQDSFEGVGLAGDWLCYVRHRYDNAFGSHLSVLEARNLVTGTTRSLVAADEWGSFPLRSWTANEHWVVWMETVVLSDETTGWRLRACDLDTGQIRTLPSVTRTGSEPPLLDEGGSDIRNDQLIWDPQSERDAADNQVAVVARVTDLSAGSEQLVRIAADDYTHVWPQWVGDDIIIMKELQSGSAYGGLEVRAHSLSTGTHTRLFRLAPNGLGEQIPASGPSLTSGCVFSGDWLVCQARISRNATDSVYAINVQSGVWRSLGREPRTIERIGVAGDRVFVWGGAQDPAQGDVIYSARIPDGVTILRPSLSKSPTASRVRLRIQKVPGVHDYAAPAYTLVVSAKLNGAAAARRRVFLERSGNGRDWTQVGSALTDSQGRVRAKLPNALGMFGWVMWRAPSVLYVRFRIDPIEGKMRGAYSSTTRITTYR